MQRPEKGEVASQSQRLGRYRIRGTLGQCGMGRLYVAEQTGIEGFTKIVALKRILPHLAHSPQFRTMFLNEARVAARLEHPNIVTTYELGEVEGIYFIAMEYLPGEDLGAVLARSRRSTRRRMPVEIGAAIAQQALSGLHHAHELPDATGAHAGLVHRDVNPSNIVVTYHGVVKVLDFGLVKEVSTPGTAPGVFKGKYGYCAPEQLEGGPVDRRTDVFCVGIVLWECLTGRRLFGGLSEAAVIDAVRMQRILPPSALRPEVPGELDSITLRALGRDRSVRFQSALEMSEMLDRYLAGLESRRPNNKTVGHWLEHLFGTERALLKKAIAQGSQVELSLQRLASAIAPRTPPGEAVIEPPSPFTEEEDEVTPNMLPPRSAGGLPMMDHSDDVTSRFEIPESLAQEAGLLAVQRLPVELPPPVQAEHHEVPSGPTGGGAGTILLGAACGGAIAVVAALVTVLARDGGLDAAERRPATPPVPVTAPATVEPAPAGGATSTLQIETRPAGALVLVDGDPVGLTTPATLRALRPGRAVDVRLEKPGYEPVVRRIEMASGTPRTLSFTLRPVAGLVFLEGVPEGATIYVDDTMTALRMPLTLSLGRRNVRVEHKGHVITSRWLDVRPGEQTIRVKGSGRGR